MRTLAHALPPETCPALRVRDGERRERQHVLDAADPDVDKHVWRCHRIGRSAAGRAQTRGDRNRPQNAASVCHRADLQEICAAIRQTPHGVPRVLRGEPTDMRMRSTASIRPFPASSAPRWPLDSRICPGVLMPGPRPRAGYDVASPLQHLPEDRCPRPAPTSHRLRVEHPQARRAQLRQAHVGAPRTGMRNLPAPSTTTAFVDRAPVARATRVTRPSATSTTMPARTVPAAVSTTVRSRMRSAVPPGPAAGGMQQGAEGEFVGPLPAVLQSGVSRERFRTGDRLNQVRHRFTVHRRARILGVERVLTSRRGRTDQVPPSFCRQTRPSQAPVPVLSRPRRSEPAPISWREH